MGEAKLSRIPQLDLGLNTADPVVSIMPGQWQTADNCVGDNGRLKSAPGFARVTNAAPNDYTYLLNGDDQYFFGEIGSTATTTNLALGNGVNGTAKWTLSVVVRVDAAPKSVVTSSVNPYMTILHYGKGTADLAIIGNFNWELALIKGVSTTNTLHFVLYVVDATPSIETYLDDTVSVEVGEWYQFVATYNGAGAGSGNVKTYIRKLGDAVPAGTSQVTVGNGTVQTAAVFGLFVGGRPIWQTSGADPLRPDKLLTLGFKGIVQELQIWNVDRTPTQIGLYDVNSVPRQLTAAEYAAETNLIYYQTLTGPADEDSYWFTSKKGTAGSGNGQSPRLVFFPRDATWRNTGHILGDPMMGTSGIHLDGRTQGFEVRDSYLYRSQVPDEDGALPFPNYFGVSFGRVKFDSIAEFDTLFHWVSLHDDDFDTTNITDTTDADGTRATGDYEAALALYLTDVSGNLRFRAAIGLQDPATGNEYIATVTAAANVVTGQAYTVTVGVNVPNRQLSIWVGTSNAVTTTWTAGYVPQRTPDVIASVAGQARRYWMALGRHINRIRSITAFGSDPNAVDVEYNFSRSLNGEIRQVVIATPPLPYDIEMLHELQRTATLTQEISTRPGLQLAAVWPLDDGAGGEAVDLGLQQNPIRFRSDPGHNWGNSKVTTTAPSQIKGLFNHLYRTAQGEEREFVAVAGGSVYSVDVTAGTLTLLADGLRNDNGNLVSAARHLDSLILCTGHGGSGNHQLVKDQLYDLAIRPPEGIIPFGLTDQGNSNAKLKKGTYRACFAYYSAHTDKWSPVGPVIEVEIRSEKANIAFGSEAEVNQTAATTGWTDKRGPWHLQEDDNNDDAGLITGGANPEKAGFRFYSWYGASNALVSTDPDWWEERPHNTTRPAMQERVYMLKNGAYNVLIDDPAAVRAEEMVNLIGFYAKRVVAEEDNRNRFKVSSVFVGANSRLLIGEREDALATHGLIADGDIFDWSMTPEPMTENGSGTLKSGTGDTAHGLVLPVSKDRQVTHLGYFRSVANGASMRLAKLLPNGTRGFVDYLSDSLNVGEVIDIAAQAPPSVEFVTEYGGRILYVKDPAQPQRAYFSQINQPWNVPAGNVVDFLDGSTLGITCVARTEGAVIIFKDDTTFVLTPPTNPVVPFTIETRTTDIGCTAPFSVVNVHETLFYPSEKGFYRFDTSFPRYLSGLIEPTYRAIPAAHRAKIVGVHDRRNEMILWGVPSGNTLDSASNVINDEMLTLDYSMPQDNFGRQMGWFKRNNMSMVCAAIVPDAAEEDRVYFADAMGYIYRHGVGANYGVTKSQTETALTSVGPLSVTAGTSTTITVPQATLANVPAGYRGFFITLVRATGATRETRLVVSDTLASPSVLTVDHAWTGAAPANGDTAYIGSIEMHAKSGELSPFGSELVHEWAETFIRQELQATQATISFLYSGSGGTGSPGSGTVSFRNNLRKTMRIGMSPATRSSGLIHEFKALGPDMPVSVVDLAMVIRSLAQHEFQVLV